MGALRFVVGLIATLALLAIAVAIFYAITLGVLYLAGRLMPLAGRRRRD